MVFKVDPAFVVANIARVPDHPDPVQACRAAYNAAVDRVLAAGRTPAQVTVTVHVTPKEHHA